MPFVKGYIQTKEQQRRAKEARNYKLGFAVCVSCKKEYKKYRIKQMTCGDKLCKYKWSKIIYDKTFGTVEGRAIRLFSVVRLGKGKKEIAFQMLSNALKKPCNYCRIEITLENASLDHKTPRIHSKVYNRKKRGMVYSREEIREVDRKENLQIICKECNSLKGKMNDNQFSRLTEFLKKNEDLRGILTERFKLNYLVFNRK